MIAICKPVLPIVKDALAHAFWKVEHLSTVHHHAGNLHVHTEINELAEDSDKDKNAQTFKTTDSVSIHILAKNNFEFAYQFVNAKSYFFKLCSLQNPFLAINCPPPKLA
ncbi:MAG: hypothetical protein H7122_05415 [Chitinophagaceae bacterium]|nr:hypothetical protein [Chitinophagaceae bacterium]